MYHAQSPQIMLFCLEVETRSPSPWDTGAPHFCLYGKTCYLLYLCNPGPVGGGGFP